MKVRIWSSTPTGNLSERSDMVLLSNTMREAACCWDALWMAATEDGSTVSLTMLLFSTSHSVQKAWRISMRWWVMRTMTVSGISTSTRTTPIPTTPIATMTDYPMAKRSTPTIPIQTTPIATMTACRTAWKSILTARIRTIRTVMMTACRTIPS